MWSLNGQKIIKLEKYSEEKNMKVFPCGKETDYEDKKNRGIISTVILGNRFKADQTLYEYLIEFLLVFVSAKNPDFVQGKMKFHDTLIEKEFSYYVEPRMALRRFVFYDKARKKGTIKEDEKAYQKLLNILTAKMEMDEEKKKECLESIQDLFHGYAVVIKNRFWGAQALLPICPEFICCGCDPSQKQRKSGVNWEDNPISVDTQFEFTKRNMLARGGEVYYLHILQGLEGHNEQKKKLEYLLNNLVGEQCEKISYMARFIQESWEEAMEAEPEEMHQEMKLSFIPANAYKDCEEHSIEELISFLSNNLQPIEKIEILAKGVMYQIMRMMTCGIANYLGIKKKAWIIDMRGKSKDSVKKIAATAYKNLESDFMIAINKKAKELHITEEKLMKDITDAKKNSLNIFKAKGKEMQCIIPSKGPFERFSLSEDIIRFLVLALIPPEEKITLHMFLNKLYEHYGIVIGPNEYRRSLEEEQEFDESLTSIFIDNEIALQGFLKETGFLRELSDATSIVVNPYQCVRKEDEE